MEGFEPPARSDRATVFKTAALNHSATYPKRGVPERTERSGTPLIIRTRPLKGTETRREHLHDRASTGSGIRTRTTTILSRLPLPIGPHRRIPGRNRTRVSGFGAHYSTIEPLAYQGASNASAKAMMPARTRSRNLSVSMTAQAPDPELMTRIGGITSTLPSGLSQSLAQKLTVMVGKGELQCSTMTHHPRNQQWIVKNHSVKSVMWLRDFGVLSERRHKIP